MAELVRVARELDLSPKAFSLDHRRLADISDHLFYLSIVGPSWFAPFCDEAVVELADRLWFNDCDGAILLAETSLDATEHVVRRLHTTENPRRDLLLLCAIGNDVAMNAVAEYVRANPGEDLSSCHQPQQIVSDAGVHVGPAGPALRRFSTERKAIFGGLSPDGECRRHLDLPLDQVVGEGEPVTWHYLSLQLGELDGLPDWPGEMLHLVSPRSFSFTAFAELDDDHRYVDVVVQHDDGSAFSNGLIELEEARMANPPEPRPLHLRELDDDVVVCNGHLFMTEGLLGVAGGTQIGLSDTPVCPGCDVLMFHAASSTTSDTSEYGEGFRSVFYCPDCVQLAVTGSGWN